MNKELCASIFVIDPDTKKILLVRHKEFQKWVQPGGHLEDNEIPEETAAREVYEETGIKVKIMGDRFPQCNRKDGYMQVDVLYYGVPIGNTEPYIDDEETLSARWFSREELDKINVFEDIKITYDYIIRDLLH